VIRKEAPVEDFAECFSDLEDPRGSNALHDLTELLFIALLATLCGATSCCDMALFAHIKEELLRSVLELKHDLPSHDTFSRVFRMIDPKAFEKVFQHFMKAFFAHLKLQRAKGVVAIDGKALRCAYERGKSHMPALMVTAWGAQTRMALANVLAEDGGEAAAALVLIEFLQLKDCIVTADALHCRRDTAEAIIARKGDYVLAVKDNQPKLLQAAKAAIGAARSKTGKRSAKRKELSHGRKESRKAFVTSAKTVAPTLDFPGLQAFAMIRSKRGKDKTVERYYLLSRYYRPSQLLAIVREHWGIENRLHWTLDVVFDEDLARNRKDNAPANLAILRRLALNIARAHPDKKTSMRGKLKRAGWDETFMFDMLVNMR
jgi:predicted transposase YbfD/YdcC